MGWKHKPGRYQPRNDGAGKMKWFAADTHIPHWWDETSNGKLRRFGSIEAAQRRADELNAELVEKV